MNDQNKVSGLILAGGRAQRMQQRDKGLLLFKGRPLISYALAALAPLVDELWISANRNRDLYAQFGYPVLADRDESFAGPLAGILAAMQATQLPNILVIPCDSPFIEAHYLSRLMTALKSGAELSIASDGKRLHPVFMAVKSCLADNLQAFLDKGERKMQTWVHQQQAAVVDFSDVPELFANINTPEDLMAFESRLAEGNSGALDG